MSTERPPDPPDDPRDVPTRPPGLRLVPPPAPAPPTPVPPAPLTGPEVRLLHRSGALGPGASAQLEALLFQLARADPVLDLALGEAWRAYAARRGPGEPDTAWTGYPREVLCGLAQLAELMVYRPLLREALRTGAVRKAHALAVLALAVGRREARWVEAARRLGLGALRKEAARAIRSGALGCCGELASCCELLEQRAVSRAVRRAAATPWRPPPEAWGPEDRVRAVRRALAPLACVPGEVDAARARARVEAETQRWARLVAGALPPGGLDAALPGPALQVRLCALLSARGRYQGLFQACAAAVLDEGAWRRHGFRGPGRYCEERLGLPAAAVRRAAAAERPAAPPVPPPPPGASPPLRAVPPPPPVISAPPALLARSEALAHAVRMLEQMFPTGPRRLPPGGPPQRPPPPPDRPPPRAG